MDQGLTVRGVNHDTGTEFRRSEISRPIWNVADVSRDMQVIRTELHCTSVNVYGTGLDRLEEAAALALRQGLHVSFSHVRSIRTVPGCWAFSGQRRGQRTDCAPPAR